MHASIAVRPRGVASPRGVRPLVAVCAAILTLAVAGAGASAASAATRQPVAHAAGLLTKIHFLADAGLAFGAFHHFIYEPAKAGDFAHPLQHKATVAEAVLAGAFVYHELGSALSLAKSDSLLTKLVSPITALEAKIESVYTSLKGGNINTAALTSSNTGVASVESTSSGLGAKISELVPPLSSL